MMRVNPHRSRRTAAIAAAIILTGACGPGPSVDSGAAAPLGTAGAIRVLSYNIRYGTADDGENSWPARRELALRVIANERPDVIGIQEALRFQLDEIAAAFPRLAETGVGRDDGDDAGEYSAILFDRERFELLDGDTFWLSDTPEVASATWGNQIPRIVTWARLKDRRTERTLYVYNTHWDHESQPSREGSAALLARRIAARAHPTDRVLITGDFNAGERNPARAILREAGFTDTYRVLHRDAADVGTFHGFEGGRDGEKIDAVLASPGWRTWSAWIVTLNENGRYPSDHYPVMAVVE